MVTPALATATATATTEAPAKVEEPTGPWVEDNFCHGYGKIWFTWDLHPKNEVYLNGTQW